jgi:3-oxoacyl-[acyl-carrier protein] reductase
LGSLDGKVAVITGAGSGIGAAGATLFAGEGARVVVADVDAARAAATVAAIESEGGRAVVCVADVAEAEDATRMIDDALTAYGRVDILWNNAGMARGAGTPLEEISIADWQLVLNVNLSGVFYAMKAVIPHMKQRRSGSIVNTASIAGLIAFVPGRAPYTAAKGGVISLTRVAALELAGFNIRVNCIAPGRVRTSMGDGLVIPEGNPFEIDWAPRVPRPATDATREARPEEIARTALYIVSDDVGPLTGAVIAHDGGATSS